MEKAAINITQVILRTWYFYLELDWDSLTVINGVKYYACKDGVLKIFPDGIIQYISNFWYENLVT
jgi:hypothetical protein